MLVANLGDSGFRLFRSKEISTSPCNSGDITQGQQSDIFILNYSKE
jgi:hypothetical protein